MGDNNQDSRQQYYQNAQQVPPNVFQQQMYNAQMGGQPQYGYQNNQMYPPQMNYNDQYQQQQYYDQEYEEDDYDNLAAIDKELGHSASYNNFDEEDEFAAEVEKEIERHHKDTGNAPVINGQLSNHAADFWFPECRNCPCCAGFKHGCKCCKGNRNVLACTDPACVDQDTVKKVSDDLAARSVTVEKVTTPTAAASSAYKVSSPHKPTAAGSGAPAGGEMCRFESGPGGCRYGASCRYKHSFPPSTNSFPAAAPVPAGPPGSKPRCAFFAKGNCQFGDSCRNGHY